VDAAEPLIADSDAVLTVLEIPVATAARAMEIARAHGVPAILNPAPARPLAADILRRVDVLTPNRTELRILTGHAPDAAVDDLALVLDLRRRGVKTVVATRGEQGALVVA
jgi:ribokinase